MINGRTKLPQTSVEEEGVIRGGVQRRNNLEKYASFIQKKDPLHQGFFFNNNCLFCLIKLETSLLSLFYCSIWLNKFLRFIFCVKKQCQENCIIIILIEIGWKLWRCFKQKNRRWEKEKQWNLSSFYSTHNSACLANNGLEVNEWMNEWEGGKVWRKNGGDRKTEKVMVIGGVRFLITRLLIINEI